MATVDHAALPAGRDPMGGFWYRVLSPLGAVVAAFVGAIIAAGLLSVTPMSEDALNAVLSVATSSLILTFGLILWHRMPAHERRLAVAVKGSRRRAVLTGVGIGLLAVAGAAVILAVGSAIDPVVHRRLDEYETAGTATWQIVLTVITYVTLAPLGEELVFRGLLLRALARRLRFWPAAVVSGLLFASAHADSYVLWPRAVSLAGTGVVLAWTYRARGYWGSVAAHATVNAIASIALVLNSGS